MKGKPENKDVSGEKDNDRADRHNKIELEQICVLHHPLRVKLDVGINHDRRRGRAEIYVRREPAAAYRRIALAELEQELAKAQRKAERYKKRYQS